MLVSCCFRCGIGRGLPFNWINAARDEMAARMVANRGLAMCMAN